MVNVRATMHTAGQNVGNTVSHLYHRAGDALSYAFSKMPMSGRIKGLFAPAAAPALNTKFLEPISLSCSPVTKMQAAAYIVAIAAGAVLAAYSAVGLVAALTASKVASIALSLLGFSLGTMVMLASLERIFNAVAALKETKLSPEQKLFQTFFLKGNTDAQIRTAFKDWTGLDLSTQYTPAQIDVIKKESKATSLEQAILPALVRFRIKAQEVEAIENAYPVQIAKSTRSNAYHVTNPIQDRVRLTNDDLDAFDDQERMKLQKLYTAKVEAAFALATLLYPDSLKKTSLSELGSVQDYSGSSKLIMSRSNLPFFLGKSLNARQVVRSVRYHEMEALNMPQLAQRLSDPYNLPRPHVR